MGYTIEKSYLVTNDDMVKKRLDVLRQFSEYLEGTRTNDPDKRIDEIVEAAKQFFTSA